MKKVTKDVTANPIPDFRVFRVLRADFEYTTVMCHNIVTNDAGGLDFYEIVKVSEIEHPDTRQMLSVVQPMLRRGFASGTWMDYEEVVSQSQVVN